MINLSTEAALSTRLWSLLVVARPLWWAGLSRGRTALGLLEPGIKSSSQIELGLPPMLRISPRSSCRSWWGTRRQICPLLWWAIMLTASDNTSRTTTATSSTISRSQEWEYQLLQSKWVMFVCVVFSCLFIRLLPLYTLTLPLPTHNPTPPCQNYKLGKTLTPVDFSHLVSWHWPDQKPGSAE